MKRKFLCGAAVLALMLVGAAAADTTGDVLTLYPVGHGAMSYADWRAQEGRPDSQGSANQALYLEATGTPDTTAAAHVRGFEGVRVTSLVSLSYEHRVPGTCTKTDPRWTLFIRGRGGLKRYLVNLGCAVTPGHATDDPHWVRRLFTQPVIQAEIFKQVPGGPAQRDALGGTIEELAIVVDRTKGAVFLDNVTVRSKTASKVWTFAGDNGNGVPASPPDFSDEDFAMLAAPLPDAALLDESDLMASVTADEWTAIQEENAAAG